MPASTIIREVPVYPTEAAARASLPEMYAGHPYRGKWLQGPDQVPVHAFSTNPKKYFTDEGWTELDQ